MQGATEPRVVVTVVRSGGIAGLRREWRAEPAPDAVARWTELIDGCPWDDPPAAEPGADRYQWRIRARSDDAPPREVRLGDGGLAGPWRTLVDEVRAQSRPRRPERPR
ncbi:hypothetical protein DEU34_0921 [Microbacterium sp. AG1240]|uniref:protealysin inhibitor emfourin n=1 Tax=Microbacterium sp. AG1240 TaxID=2183992 RepID=UPI000EADD097|nr:protealysin inhibitor emfourin [Microbacterium sp. AG1240]RKT36408.1 hypothetical protein DEU34_0921 [Microbacterium sp. AG1240]